MSKTAEKKVSKKQEEMDIGNGPELKYAFYGEEIARLWEDELAYLLFVERNVMGRLYTFVESIMGDGKQAKATKDMVSQLIKPLFFDATSDIREIIERFAGVKDLYDVDPSLKPMMPACGVVSKG